MHSMSCYPDKQATTHPATKSPGPRETAWNQERLSPLVPRLRDRWELARPGRPETPSMRSSSADKSLAGQTDKVVRNTNSGSMRLAATPSASPLRISESVFSSQDHLPRERKGKFQVGGQGRPVFRSRIPRTGLRRGESSRLEKVCGILLIQQITSTSTERLQADLTGAFCFFCDLRGSSAFSAGRFGCCRHRRTSLGHTSFCVLEACSMASFGKPCRVCRKQSTGR